MMRVNNPDASLYNFLDFVRIVVAGSELELNFGYASAYKLIFDGRYYNGDHMKKLNTAQLANLIKIVLVRKLQYIFLYI